MRAMLSCRIGPVGRASVERALAAMGWLPDHPDDSPYLHERRAALLAKLPDPVRAELTAQRPVLITTFPNVWGFACFDRREALLLCLFSDDLEVLKQQCVQVVAGLPPALDRVALDRSAPDRVATEHRCTVDPHVEIRRFDGNALVALGIVSDTGHVRFRRYVWSVRRRERVVLLSLTGLCALSMIAALVLYLRFPSPHWTYLRGYLDRLSSAVQTATVIMGVNLVFEYRDWKGSAAVIEWRSAH